MNHVIHLNLTKDDCENIDVLEAYFFARVLDYHLNQALGYQDKVDDEQKVRHRREAIAKTEKMCANLNGQMPLLKQRLLEKGWSLDFLYLDSTRWNRYILSEDVFSENGNA